MWMFAQVSAEELSIRSSIESLGRLFAIVMALAIGEAFKQFVSDKAEKPEDRHIHWNRLWALVAFVMLVVPFSHGMARYFFETYQEAGRPRPYYAFLFFDSIIFTVEAVLFFIMSRALPEVQWRRFYWSVVVLLILDVLWGSVAAHHHAPSMWAWVRINSITAAVLGCILWRTRDAHSTFASRLSAIVVICRTVADYYWSFDYYFPPQP